ncbi:MAG TPA: ABC transporter ATP-binding protein [Myxococcota bacterium]
MSLALHDVVVGTDPVRLQATLRFDVGLHVVVGDNGAGKSTLLDVCAGVLRPTSGRVVVDDLELGALSPRERARRIASLAQQPPLVPGLVARTRIAQGLVARRGVDAAIDDDTAARIATVARRLDIEALLDRRLETLSGGQRQRVHLARALIDDDAKVLVLDEPYAGLDDGAARRLTGALCERAARQIVIVSVHDLGIALALGGRLIGIKRGAVVVDHRLDVGTLDEDADRIFSDPVRVVVDGDLIGVLRRR